MNPEASLWAKCLAHGYLSRPSDLCQGLLFLPPPPPTHVPIRVSWMSIPNPLPFYGDQTFSGIRLRYDLSHALANRKCLTCDLWHIHTSRPWADTWQWRLSCSDVLTSVSEHLERERGCLVRTSTDTKPWVRLDPQELVITLGSGAMRR